MPTLADLEAFVDEGIRRSKAAGYNPSVCMRLCETRGTKRAIEQLVISGDIQSGFKKMSELNMLEWTLENAVVRFRELFSTEHVAAAEWRLQQARVRQLG